MNPIHTFTLCVFNIRFSIILVSAAKSSKWHLPFIFSAQNFVCISRVCSANYMWRSSHPPWFDRPNNIYWTLVAVYCIRSVLVCTRIQTVALTGHFGT